MIVKILENADTIADEVSGIIIDQIKAKNSSVLGLATGATPIPTYNKLIEAYRCGEVSFADTVTFNLDEYSGIPTDSPESYHTYMREHLFKFIDIDPGNTHVPLGDPEDTAAYCRSYDKSIEKVGGIDIQLLGLGKNGHIGFNEPADAFTEGTFRVKLSKSTADANGKYFSGTQTMPSYAITMGIGTIMKAKRIILIACGESKAEAVRAMVKGSVTPMCPASILQTHNDATVYLDPPAAMLL